jgi:hypothetical protein
MTSDRSSLTLLPDSSTPENHERGATGVPRRTGLRNVAAFASKTHGTEQAGGFRRREGSTRRPCQNMLVVATNTTQLAAHEVRSSARRIVQPLAGTRCGSWRSRLTGIARCDPARPRRNCRTFGSRADAAAAFNGFSQRHLYGVISASGNSAIRITRTVNAATESLRPGSWCESESGRGVTARCDRCRSAADGIDRQRGGEAGGGCRRDAPIT